MSAPVIGEKEEGTTIATDLNAKSRFDLGYVVKRICWRQRWGEQRIVIKIRHHYYWIGINQVGLQGLCKKLILMLHLLPRNECDCQSDWTNHPLLESQITYAARDAYGPVLLLQ